MKYNCNNVGFINQNTKIIINNIKNSLVFFERKTMITKDQFFFNSRIFKFSIKFYHIF